MGDTARVSQFTPHDPTQQISHGHSGMFCVHGDAAQAFDNFINAPGRAARTSGEV